METRPANAAPVGLGRHSRKYDLRIEEFPNALLADSLSPLCFEHWCQAFLQGRER